MNQNKQNRRLRKSEEVKNQPMIKKNLHQKKIQMMIRKKLHQKKIQMMIKKKLHQKKDKNDQEQSRIEHFKKLLRISGIRIIMKKSELDQFSSNKAKIDYLKSLFQTAGFTGLIFLS